MASSETPKKSASLFQSLGTIKNWQKEKHGIIVVTSYGKLRLQAYDQGTIRVSISRNDQFEDFSYSVVKKPSSVNFKIVEQKKSIRLVTRQMVCEVQKDPARIRFLDKKDQVINEDDPAFGTAWMNNEVTTYKELQEGERFLGLGEKTGNLDRRGSGYTNWNTEKFGYGTNDDPIYLSIPFYLGIHNGLVYGIFLNNSYLTQMNFGASNRRYSSFGAEEGEMDYFFFHGSTVAEVINLYGDITGRMPMPPLWSLGFQQCRYSYYPDKEVLNLARTFREKEIPADTIVLDIHYMEGYKVFKWDHKRFPNPAKMIRDLKKLGFNIVLIIDPGIKIEKGY
ncbi:MAG: DUF4968 domain-containing protein, partial [Bacteroidetes bacterium]|nr:DUF4968 domain-containing protein [Bacteroidota bacterium]